MAGKHVKPTDEGESQQRRLGLAIGLAILTGLLCIAVLILSANRRADTFYRRGLAERAEELADYQRLGDPLKVDAAYELQETQRRFGALCLRLPKGFWIRQEAEETIGETEFRAVVITNGTMIGEFWLPADGAWQPGMRERLIEEGLNPPTRGGENRLIGYLLDFDADRLADEVAQPRQPIEVAREAWAGLLSRQMFLRHMRRPLPFQTDKLQGFVQLATIDDPSVYAVVTINGRVAAEARVTKDNNGWLADEDSLTELNESWPLVISGLMAPELEADAS